MRVLNAGYVRVADVLGSELNIVNAARASFQKESTEFTDKDGKLIRYLIKHGHTSPLRHAFITYEIKAPLMVARQMFKYRVGSAQTGSSLDLLGVPNIENILNSMVEGNEGDDILQARNEASRRYVTIEPEFYVPDIWRSAPDNAKQGSGAGAVTTLNGEPITDIYNDLVTYSLYLYKESITNGVAPEMARLFLPAYGLYLVWRWTASVQGVVHFLNQRLDQHAQYEVQQYAKAVQVLTKPHFPNVII